MKKASGKKTTGARRTNGGDGNPGDAKKKTKNKKTKKETKTTETTEEKGALIPENIFSLFLTQGTLDILILLTKKEEEEDDDEKRRRRRRRERRKRRRETPVTVTRGEEMRGTQRRSIPRSHLRFLLFERTTDKGGEEKRNGFQWRNVCFATERGG